MWSISLYKFGLLNFHLFEAELWTVISNLHHLFKTLSVWGREKIYQGFPFLDFEELLGKFWFYLNLFQALLHYNWFAGSKGLSITEWGVES